jgi:hypothetical protein
MATSARVALDSRSVELHLPFPLIELNLNGSQAMNSPSLTENFAQLKRSREIKTLSKTRTIHTRRQQNLKWRAKDDEAALFHARFCYQLEAAFGADGPAGSFVASASDWIGISRCNLKNHLAAIRFKHRVDPDIPAEEFLAARSGKTFCSRKFLGIRK